MHDMPQRSPEPPEDRPRFLHAAPPTGEPRRPGDHSPTDTGDSERTLHLALTPVASALGPARDSARMFLRGFDVPEATVFDIVLSLEEACKNAIRFSGSQRDIDVTVAVSHARGAPRDPRPRRRASSRPTSTSRRRPTSPTRGAAGSFSSTASWTTCASPATTAPSSPLARPSYPDRPRRARACPPPGPLLPRPLPAALGGSARLVVRRPGR